MSGQTAQHTSHTPKPKSFQSSGNWLVTVGKDHDPLTPHHRMYALHPFRKPSWVKPFLQPAAVAASGYKAAGGATFRHHFQAPGLCRNASPTLAALLPMDGLLHSLHNLFLAGLRNIIALLCLLRSLRNFA